MVKNRDLGTENAAFGLRSRTAFSSLGHRADKYITASNPELVFPNIPIAPLHYQADPQRARKNRGYSL